ncbi:MGH1-like glycoside hydrolase domain-containing protein [Autumnicola musiva]|uniref:Trehalase family glycosidase n=1 Tax=Autumnicola musiva TaxID=3075589 RepID=A0ABU3D7S7_9FLAO|nr:glycosyl hydrolase family 65 protein [Zunongwangia sp. F117]MDT0677587.1 trehalase family glycosidase [Zunongwangia sp. F117]
MCAKEELKSQILQPDKLQEYVKSFNDMYEEEVVNYISDEESFKWLENNIPLFEAPDPKMEEIYYFRWWTFRKHLKKTSEGFVFTEFITPVSHGGNYNTISSALGHHINEGRWLHNDKYMDEYIIFWLIRDKYAEKSFHHKFSGWLAHAVYQRYLVNNDDVFLISLINELDADYLQWQEEKRLPNGMYWQYDVRDAMEESISGSRTEKNIRPTINSYMYGNAKAMAKMAKMINRDSLKEVYTQRAEKLRELVHENLWSEDENFFEVRLENGELADVREAIGYIPWYFNLPKDYPEYAEAWKQINDTEGFKAPYGLTTAEQRHPEFRTHGTGTSEWDGAVWPYASTQTLKALANLLTNYSENFMTKEDYFRELKKYAMAHEKDGKPFIGEYFDEQTNEHLHGDKPRSVHYNHSGYVDLIINDLIGLKPREDNILEVEPLLPEGQWDWFCLDKVKYHDRILTFLWDRNGKKYGRGSGFRIFVDDEEIFHANSLGKVIVDLSERK